MKIGYLSLSNAESGGEWSGTTKNIFNKLNSRYEVITIDLSENFIWKIINFSERARYRISKNRGIIPNFVSKYYANQLVKKLKDIDLDCLVIPVGSTFLANLETNLPIIYLSDATYSLLNDYYYFNVPKREQKRGNMYELLSLKKSDAIIESSEWAKSSVVNDYSISEDKVHVIPFGANMPDLYKKYQSKTYTNVNILFIGVDYKRKGANKAIKVVNYLNEKRKGNFKLHLVGISDEYGEASEHIIFYGKLHKNDSNDFAKLVELFNTATLFLLPTIADATPIVFAEACQFSLPIISHRIGGLSTFVAEGINGHLLPLDSSPEQMGDKILDLVNDPKKLQGFSRQARIMYEEKFNWDSWLDSFDFVIKKYKGVTR